MENSYFERRSHFISIGVVKFSFEAGKLDWKGGGSGKFFKKWCDFMHSKVFFSTNFASFFFQDIFLVFFLISLV